MTTSEIRRLVDAVALADVRFFEVHGQVDLPTEGTDQPDNTGFELTIQTGERADERGLIAILTSTWTQSPVRLHVVVGGLYDVSKDLGIEYDDELLEEFGDRVARYQLLPFAREGVASLATRLRITPPLIPLVPQRDGPGDLADGEELGQHVADPKDALEL